MRLTNDSRDWFPYALKCGTRRWKWLYNACPQDFTQTISLVCCLESEKSVKLARLVNNALYRLAIEQGFHRFGGTNNRHFRRESEVWEMANELKEYWGL